MGCFLLLVVPIFSNECSKGKQEPLQSVKEPLDVEKERQGIEKFYNYF